MIELYNQYSFSASQSITRKYSTSFTLGISLLEKRLHDPIYAVYGLVRLADEIVDSFHQHNKTALLSSFKKETFKAIEEGVSTNPIIHSYQIIANHYKIENELTEAFFNSMEMDLEKVQYDQEKYQKYIYGSAEVVGLMCIRIFTDNNENLYQELKPGAKALGAAFQKVNFLRDIQSDFQDRGRTYFPGVDFVHFTEQEKREIEEDIESDFKLALTYIKKLPKSSRIGVYLAYKYYLGLYKKIKEAAAADILKKRYRVPNLQKIWILIKTMLRSRAGRL